MHDKRLLGTWKSDTRRTMREIRNLRSIPEASHKPLKKILGRLTVRYTRARVYMRFDDQENWDEPYRVVAKDDHSVVIVFPDADLDEERICQVHFAKRHYWVWCDHVFAPSPFREFFRHVE